MSRIEKVRSEGLSDRLASRGGSSVLHVSKLEGVVVQAVSSR